MSLGRVTSSALVGIDAYGVTVEVDVHPGLGNFIIVGLPDIAVNESKERVRTAIKNSGLSFPHTRITVNLAPADVRKEGPNFDLPIALGILAATGQLSPECLSRALILGELGLARPQCSKTSRFSALGRCSKPLMFWWIRYQRRHNRCWPWSSAPRWPSARRTCAT